MRAPLKLLCACENPTSDFRSFAPLTGTRAVSGSEHLSARNTRLFASLFFRLFATEAVSRPHMRACPDRRRRP